MWRVYAPQRKGILGQFVLTTNTVRKKVPFPYSAGSNGTTRMGQSKERGQSIRWLGANWRETNRSFYV